MRYLNEEFWEATLDGPDTGLPKTPLSYYFLLRNPDGSVVEDFGGDRNLDFSRQSASHTVVIDSWNELGTVENVFFTEPFRNILLRRKSGEIDAEPPGRDTHEFNVKAPLLPDGQTVCLLGSADSLGAWNQANPILLRRRPENGSFTVRLDLAGQRFPIAYKYGVYDAERKVFIRV